MFLIERTISNYFLLPTAIFLFIWFLPYLPTLIFKRNFFINPVISLNFSFIFLFFLGTLVIVFRDLNLYSIFLLFGLTFLIKYGLLYKNRQYFSKFSSGEAKIVFSLLLISIFILSFSELVKDFPAIGSLSFREEVVNPNQYFEPFLNYEADYILPLNSAGRYLSGKEALSAKILTITNVTDRTPLFYFSLIPLLKVLGWNFFPYQMICIVFSVLWIAPAYLIAREYLKKLDAVLCCLVLSFSQFFLLISTFGQTKTITLFFILTAIWLIIKLSRKNIYLSAGLSSLVFTEAYFSHQFSLIYYLAGFLIFLILKKSWEMMTLYLAPLLLVHFLWNRFVSFIGTPNLVYQNILFSRSLGEAGANIEINEIITLQEALSFVFSRDFLLNKFYNFLGLFFFNPRPGVIRVFSFHDITIPGALGIFLLSFFILALFRTPFSKFKFIFYFTVLVSLLAILYHGFYLRMGLMWYVLGIIPLMSIYVFSFIRTFFKSNRTAIFFTTLAISENLYVHWTKGRYDVFSRLMRFWQLRPAVVLGFAVIVGLFSFLLIKSVLIKRQNRENG